MMNLTFGEQVKIILSRKGMTIKELAELVEKHTGKPMSRQNMTQRLGRDNFQEQDMRMIAEILGCEFTLTIMEPMIAKEQEVVDEFVQEENEVTRDITIGELVEENVIEPVVEEEAEKVVEGVPETANEMDSFERETLRKGIKGFFRKGNLEPVNEKEIPSEPVGDINPYTRKEYESNSVRMHPKRIGYVQVYDRETHKWTDMTEWAFLGYQEQKKMLLGKDYDPPIYLD
jgi:hypothetical protein